MLSSPTSKIGFAEGVHRVGSLARLAVADKMIGDEASKLAERYYKFFGRLPLTL